jgi:hypothetical protein
MLFPFFRDLSQSNLITGSKGRADSGKERRKRKREMVAAGGSQLEARKWANPKLQKQAFRCGRQPGTKSISRQSPAFFA